MTNDENDTLRTVLSFAVGAVVGGGIVYLMKKDKAVLRQYCEQDDYGNCIESGTSSTTGTVSKPQYDSGAGEQYRLPGRRGVRLAH